MSIVYTNDNIFKSLPHSIILHACNCKGSWGAGIAREIARLYPNHYAEYREFCKNVDAIEALGGCLFINESVDNKTDRSHYIGCLFTNVDYGSKHPTKEQIDSIINATNQSFQSLLSQIDEGRKNGMRIGEIHMPKINAGYFGVPWELTERCINKIIENTDWIIYVHTF